MTIKYKLFTHKNPNPDCYFLMRTRPEDGLWEFCFIRTENKEWVTDKRNLTATDQELVEAFSTRWNVQNLTEEEVFSEVL
jgi:hypothetical protein